MPLDEFAKTHSRGSLFYYAVQAEKDRQQEKRRQEEKKRENENYDSRILLWSGSVSKPSFDVNEFENREEKIKEMAETCVENLKEFKKGSSMSTQRVLLTSAQMWGTGKTTLGMAFLPVLRTPKYKDFLDELRTRYESELVDTLLKSEYVYLDLRSFRTRFYEHGNANEWVKLMIMGYFFRNYPEDRLYLARADKVTSLQDIVHYFSGKYDHHFFFHLDEIEYYPFCQGIDIISISGTEIVKSFNRLWSDIFPLQEIGHNVLFTGRSALIYALGKGWYPETPSPSSAKCILLDPLKENHIREILKKKFESNSLSDQVMANWAEKIYQRTGGVPRLMEAAITLLSEELSPSLPEELENWGISLLEKPFLEYLEKPKFCRQLNPYEWMLGNEHFERILTLAVLGIPLPLDTLEPMKYWVVGSVDGDVRVPFMEILRLYNVYIEKMDKEQWRIFFPQITLEAIMKRKNLGKNSRFLISLLLQSERGPNNLDSNTSMTTLFPDIIARCFRLRLKEQYESAPLLTLEESLPFLKGSFVGKETVQLSGTNPLKFPKISTNAKKLEGDKGTKKLEKAKESIRKSGTRIHLDQSLEFHPDDWPILQKELLEPNHLYIPAYKSSSCDQFVTTMTNSGALPSLQVQVKSGPILETQVLDEIIKVLPSYRGYPLTLLIVSLSPNEQFGKGLSREVVKGEGNTPLAYRFQADQFICEKSPDPKKFSPVPKMDIVYLLEDGLKHFISPYNYHLLRQLDQQ